MKHRAVSITYSPFQESLPFPEIPCISEHFQQETLFSLDAEKVKDFVAPLWKRYIRFGWSLTVFEYRPGGCSEKYSGN